MDVSAKARHEGRIDYLDRPPQRHLIDGIEYVKFTDIDLYMFEGGQLMLQALERISQLEAEVNEWRKRCIKAENPLRQRTQSDGEVARD